MKIHLLSDLHFEFGGPPADYRAPDCDIVLLAGDIAEDMTGIDWAQQVFKVPVLLTPGNHEFYAGKQIRVWIDELKTYAAGSNVHVLHNDIYELNGVRFVGATLWSDFNLYGHGQQSAFDARKGLNDYRRIRRPSSSGRKRRLRTDDTLGLHIESRRFIRQAIESFEGATVVMTHHAPSERSIPAAYRAAELTPAYASNLELLIKETRPVLWAHGHVHSNSDYRIGETRVICNPRGYFSASELNPDFDSGFVVEI